MTRHRCEARSEGCKLGVGVSAARCVWCVIHGERDSTRVQGQKKDRLWIRFRAVRDVRQVLANSRSVGRAGGLRRALMENPKPTDGFFPRNAQERPFARENAVRPLGDSGGDWCRKTAAKPFSLLHPCFGFRNFVV